jgi:DNA-binding transcriptional MerR regulator
MSTLRIGELAGQGRVNLETIRYYERVGLLTAPKRTPSGHRAYASGDLLRLRFIRRVQSLGFTLNEIKELLALEVSPTQPCIDVVHQIEAKEHEIQVKIAHLQAIHRTLRQMKASCAGKCSVSECPILGSLNSETRS